MATSRLHSGIENAFLRAHGPGDDAAVGRDNHAAAAAIGTAQERLGRRVGLEHLDHALVHCAAGRDHEGLAHLREGLCVHRHTIAQGIAAGGKVVRPAHDVNAGAFGGEREHG